MAFVARHLGGRLPRWAVAVIMAVLLTMAVLAVIDDGWWMLAILVPVNLFVALALAIVSNP